MNKRVLISLALLLCLTNNVQSSAYAETSIIESVVNSSSETDTINTEIYETKADFVNGLRDNFLAHKKSFTVSVSSNVLKEVEDIYKAIASTELIIKNSTSTGGDYLYSNVHRYEFSWIHGKEEYSILKFTVEYATTIKQEKKLSAQIKSILKKLELDDATDYNKVKTIHDYIINIVNYDETYSKFSAYNALINKTAVCQGYSLLAYRMFNDAGIPCRVIEGLGNGGDHAWNIVKVDGKWYNIDLTWDDPLTPDRTPMLSYDYFLKNDIDFIEHVRDAKYNTSSFLKKYRIADDSLKIN